MRFSIYQESRIGARKSNQDRMGYCYTRDALLLLLADGMGGHAGGDIAAHKAVQTIGACFQNLARPVIAEPERFLQDALFAAHREIHRFSADRQLAEAPRTTIVACLIQYGVAIWAHCGDSRLYWMRKGTVLTRTRDHSGIEALIAQGRADPGERATHPERNRIFNCLGGPAVPRVALSPAVRLDGGDVLLLCSDGLWGVVPDAALADEFRRHPVGRAVPSLLNRATAAAGRRGDNVTALAMMWEGAGAQVDSTVEDGTRSSLARFDEFSDDDIEEGIAEIRAAIDRSGRLAR